MYDRSISEIFSQFDLEAARSESPRGWKRPTISDSNSNSYPSTFDLHENLTTGLEDLARLTQS